MKVGVYVAHDDDSILGVGGRIARHIKNNDDVYVVICNDGRNCFKVNFGIESNPSIWEVKAKRKEEIKKAMGILGLKEEKLYFLRLENGEGRVRENKENTEKQLLEITKKEKPNLVYFHYPDAHPDHRAVGAIMIEILDEIESKPEAFQFVIWTKELSKGRNDVDENKVPELPSDYLKINIKKEVELKRKSILQMKSQVEKHPYPEWQVLERSVLDKSFIDHFLKGEEIFVKVN